MLKVNWFVPIALPPAYASSHADCSSSLRRFGGTIGDGKPSIGALFCNNQSNVGFRSIWLFDV